MQSDNRFFLKIDLLFSSSKSKKKKKNPMENVYKYF